MEAARQAGIAVASLSVQSTTLDDVFVHYTGHQLRDALQSAADVQPRLHVQPRSETDAHASHLGHHRT